MSNSTVYDLSNFDITNIREKTVFYVDTNIWYWLTYADAEMAQYQGNYATKIYDIYSSEQTMLAGSKLTYTEVANLVERQHMQNNHISSRDKKTFRQNEIARDLVVNDIEISINQIENMTSKSTFIEDLNSVPAQGYVDILRKTVLDPTDALMSAFITNNEIIHIITDDVDFYSVSGLKIYTYNSKMIAKAEAESNLG
ncbi:PIN domain-containing protein [Leuconostoc mesenteroides]|uniref:PIN domain-containing protein n=1 Tax=Leuconostoc mesenteroides TaxID=1245 RepID=UPI0021BED51E|nr:PIN domain-containing protein [Leuconostoc mesenteroides]MCT8386133.1 PIN domain-containing protein [Leuconostoc mesenteroides]